MGHGLEHPCVVCFQTFATASLLETHSATSHEHQCTSCRKVLATRYQLDLHISERHDPFFAVALERSGPDNKLYECLVESCTERFESDAHRAKHLVAAHAYPAWFSFHGKAQAKVQKQRYRDKKSKSREGTLCKFLASKDGCRYGDKCRFSHDASRAERSRSLTLSSSMDEGDDAAWLFVCLL